MTSDEAMQEALYQRAEEKVVSEGDFEAGWNAALEWVATQNEPVGWVFEDDLSDEYPYDAMFPYSQVDVVRIFPVYAPQLAKPLKRLTEDEILDMYCEPCSDREMMEFANAIMDKMIEVNT